MPEEAVMTEAPAAAESSAAPVTPSTPATESVAAPAVPSTPAAPRDPEQALRDAVGKVMDKQPGFEITKPAQTPEEKAAAEKAAAEAAKPAVQQTPEEKAAADAKAAEEKAAAEAKAKEGQPEPNPLDKLGPLPVETLAKAITGNPELASALEKAGIDSELLYETSRRAALTDQYTEIFPTPDAAKFAGESAQHFYDIEESFPKIQTVEDLDKFVTGTMLPLSVIYGADGKPLMNADGKGYQTDGSIARFFNATSQFETVGAVGAVDRLLAEYEKIPGEEGERLKGEASRIREALVLSQQFRDSGYRLPGAKPVAGARSPEDQKAIDEAQRIKADAEKATADARQKEDDAWHDGTLTAVLTTTGSFIKDTLDRTSLNDNEKRFIAEKAQTEAWEALANNRHFQANKLHLYTLGNTEQNRGAVVSLTKTAFQIAATKIMNRLVEEAGGKQISRQDAKLKKIDTQRADDKMNQGTGTTPGTKVAPTMTASQVREQAITNLKARNKGATPDDGEILAETMAIRGLNQRTA